MKQEDSVLSGVQPGAHRADEIVLAIADISHCVSLLAHHLVHSSGSKTDAEVGQIISRVQALQKKLNDFMHVMQDDTPAITLSHPIFPPLILVDPVIQPQRPTLERVLAKYWGYRQATAFTK